MDQARIELFLDEGWSLIGRLHQWLARWPEASSDQQTIDGLIRGLQAIWATSDDLGVKRLARTSLALEQMLERFYAGTLEFSAERLEDFTKGIGCLQELLLGLEATREEPLFSDLDAILQLERHAHLANWVSDEEDSAAATENIVKIPAPPLSFATEVESDGALSSPLQIPDADAVPITIERTLIRMLEQFVVKLDDTCQQLHARMLIDQSPYVTTTSRLEHLAQVTRELVEQIILQPRNSNSIMQIGSAKDSESLLTVDQILTPLVEEVPFVVEDLDIQIAPTTFSVELAVLDNEFAELQLKLPIIESITPQIGPSVVDFKPKSGRILIVEPSLFYRHLLGTAVHSAKYETHIVDSFERGIEALQQASDFIAVLVDSLVHPAMAVAIKHQRQANGLRVIGLTTSAQKPSTPEDFDDCVSRSHPQKLISTLDRVLNESTNHIRISA